jgi:hypothetical protein
MTCKDYEDRSSGRTRFKQPFDMCLDNHKYY